MILSLAVAIGCTGCGSGSEDDDVIYQVGRLDALSAGDYDGTVPYRTLEQLGDFGLGTFDALDGEMVAVDASFWQVRIDGVPSTVNPDEATAPFANVTEFAADSHAAVPRPMTCADLQATIEERLGDLDGYYAIRVDATFDRVLVRSVPAQMPPYPPLADVVAVQTEFDLENVDGTLVGFRFPAAEEGRNVTGFHFHFVTDARDAGGHLLDCSVRTGTIEVDRSSRIESITP